MEFRSIIMRGLATLVPTAAFNTVIAVLLTILDFGGGWWANFIFSQSIGLTMCSFIVAGHYLVGRASILGYLTMLLVAMPAGAAAGTFIGARIGGYQFGEILRGRPAPFIQILFIGIVFGTAITYYFLARKRIAETETRLREEQIKRLTLEKQTLETHLNLLQAQIEPHFLFNTLSNVLSLLETDADRGKTMLEDLTRYLRASLSRTRKRTTTLGQEMDLVRSFLDIYKVRMGERLRYAIEVPDGIMETPFPPMLVQPLVENAIKHGIEPKIDGGEIRIKVEENGDCYRCVVSDTGSGMSEEAIEGIGIANVRRRLEALFHGKGRLVLEDNQPSGLKVTMEIPHE